MTKRVCGPCTICCLHFAVPKIQKPTGQWCEHCTIAGCSIHATRPQPCRNFECFWLMDESFPDDLRPDRSGIVVSFNGEDHDSVVLHLDPAHSDVLAEPPGSEMLQALLTEFDPIFIVCGAERMMVRRTKD